MSTWLNEVIPFFLRGLKAAHLATMIIVFVLLVMLLPESLKQAVDAKMFTVYGFSWLYYLFLLAISYLLAKPVNTVVYRIYMKICSVYRQCEINLLSKEEKKILLCFIVKHELAADSLMIHEVMDRLIRKGILTLSSKNRYRISDKYYSQVLRYLTVRYGKR